jgi:hypothetical protein
MATFSSKAASGTLILGLALALGACGGSETATTVNNSAVDLNAMGGTGNDASAMDTMGNMGAPMGDMPTNTGTTNTSGSSTLGNDSGASAGEDAGAPGGDTGGNVQSNVSGM